MFLSNVRCDSLRDITISESQLGGSSEEDLQSDDLEGIFLNTKVKLEK